MQGKAEKVEANRAQILRQAVSDEVKKQEFVSLDIEFTHTKELGNFAVIQGRYFEPARPGMAWGEPHDVRKFITVTSTGLPYVTTSIPQRIPTNRGGYKEHLGVRERGIPRHSKL
ncbi:MAG: hypothetical protein AAB573_02830 [Patescibacteria group bacterium]